MNVLRNQTNNDSDKKCLKCVYFSSFPIKFNQCEFQQNKYFKKYLVLFHSYTGAVSNVVVLVGLLEENLILILMYIGKIASLLKSLIH